MDDTISRQSALDALHGYFDGVLETDTWSPCDVYGLIEILPSAQPTLHGYNIDHLELIARVLQKENLPPARVVEALTDTGRIVAIVIDEFEETLRKAVEQCKI